MTEHVLKKNLKNIRRFFTAWIAKSTLSHLEAIRASELKEALSYFPLEGRVLEIGAGTGWQAKALAAKGYNVSAIDVSVSNLKAERIYPIIDYDGKEIPFGNNTFDIVFSGNVLEHIEHIYEFQKEIHRVLKPNGVAIHVLPSSSWRLWSNITEILKKWRIPLVHGEIAVNAFVEIYTFSRKSWLNVFRETGWEIENLQSMGLFYTGSSIMDSRLTIGFRRSLSQVLGSSCNIFVLKSLDKK